VLVLIEEPTFLGCVLECALIGVIEANSAGERIRDVPKGGRSSIVHESVEEFGLGAEFQKIASANQLTKGLSKGLLPCLEK
jgi:hypothetical protein